MSLSVASIRCGKCRHESAILTVYIRQIGMFFVQADSYVTTLAA
jgi:hypothetical protein